ncbi:prostatic acid phosphatase-like [Contarinia nasturtii]|uniref:prostatic acid phosphatase-like n=1 Tax=Contarinia nasturtii TaxID=265458 RepID=UPI0012D42683|nr:prostatic acid phosphatase-like [Contarinia nasturtii]
MLEIRKCVVIVLLLCVNSIKCEIDDGSKQGQLVFAHVIYRHGDRTPVDPYPNDPYKDRKYWEEGYGQLTNVGKEQHYQLGQFFRKRYRKLLENGNYLRDFIYVQSTDVDRTLMSAESNLAGLFPPEGNQIWDNQIKWQPVPIHTIPEQLDGVLASKRPCARYTMAAKKYQKSQEFQDLLNKYKSLFQYLEQNSGTSIKTLDDAQYLYNTLWIENLKNYTLPEWTKKIFPGGDLQWVADRSFQVQTNTPELARLKSGFLLREMLDRFDQKIASKLNPDRGVWVYSAHDTTVANILNSLQLFEPPRSPPYTATVLFELYKKGDSYYIEIFYKNSTNENLSPLNMPTCGVRCSIRDFRRIYETVIPTESFEKECEVSLLSLTYEEVEYRGLDGSWLALTLLLLVVLAIVLMAWKMFQQERNMRWYHRI